MFPALLAAALAAPTLDLAADVAQPGLRTWWREGELVVAVAEDDTALRPLVDLSPTQRPAQLDAWTELGASCKAGAALSATAKVDGQTLRADLIGESGAHVVRVMSGDKVLAARAVGRPFEGCELRLVQADSVPGLEVVLNWRFGETDARIHGVMVFRVPESATATP